MPLDYDYIAHADVDWRWSSVPLRIFGLDPIVLLILPLLFGFGFSFWAVVVAVLFTSLLIYIAIATKRGSLWGWIGEQRTRFVQRRKWEVGES